MVEILFSRPYEEIVKIANAYNKSKINVTIWNIFDFGS